MKKQILISSEEIITTEILLNYIKEIIAKNGNCYFLDIKNKFYNDKNTSNLCRKLKSLKTFKLIDWNHEVSFKNRRIVLC